VEGERREGKKLAFKPTFDYLLNKYTKAGLKDRVMKRPRSPLRQDRREQPKQAKPEAKGKKVADSRVSQPPHSTHPMGHPGASSSTSFPGGQMQWCPPPMMPIYPIWDPYRQIWVNYPLVMPMTPWGWGAPRPPIFERLEFLVNDRVDPASGQQRLEPANEGKTALKSEVERATTDDIIQIGTSQVKLGEEFNRPAVIDD
jgi:hypothetical protein